MKERERKHGTMDRSVEEEGASSGYEEREFREEPRSSSRRFEQGREDVRRREFSPQEPAYAPGYEPRERRRLDRGPEEHGPYSGRGPRNFRRSDERIFEEVGELLTRDAWLDASDIEVDVRNGEVHLRGAVQDREAKRRAEDIVENAVGVVDVHNEIRVQRGRFAGDDRQMAEGRAAGVSVAEGRGTATAARYATVVGVFQDLGAAEGVLEELRRAGFARDQLSIVGKDRGRAGIGGPEAKAAGAGAVLGGIAGGALGWLLGIGALTIPGIGPIIAAGALATTLGGVAAGAVAGGLIGALVGLGIPEAEARGYEATVREGGVLVVVTASTYDEEERAEEILRGAGASDVRSHKGRGRDEVLGEKVRGGNGDPMQRETARR